MRTRLTVPIQKGGSKKTRSLMQVGQDYWWIIARATGSADTVLFTRSLAQIPYIIHGTLRDMILFGLPFRTSRYETVVQQCGLTSDFSMFANGYQQEIGANGVTLSGGQRARLSLAVSIGVPLRIR